AAAVVVIWIVAVDLNGGTAANHLSYRVPATAVAGVYGASLPDQGPLRWFLQASPIRWVGKISYGLYLSHWPIYLLVTPERAARIVPGDGLVTGNRLVALHIALTFAMATVSYYLVEKPVLERRFPVIQRPLVPAPAALVGAGVVILILAGLLQANGARPASAEEAQARVEYILPAGIGPEDRILVVGDSVAVQIGEQLKEFAAENPGQLVVFNEAHTGCVVGRYGEKIVPNEPPGPVGDLCSAWNDPVSPEEMLDPEVVSWPTAVSVFQPTIVIGHITPWDVADRKVPALGDRWV